MTRFISRFLLATALLIPRAASAANITLAVDATEAARKVVHAHLVIPATPGPITLLYPKWIPGEHGPTGPLQDLVNVRFSAGGSTVVWNRDPLEMYEFHLTVPPGADRLEADLDFLSPVEGGNFTAGQSASNDLAILAWNTVVLYPQGTPADELMVDASLTLPNDWKFASALPLSSSLGNHLSFKPASLLTLIDSPVQIARYQNIVTLVPSGELAKDAKAYLLDIPHEIDIASDSAAGVMTPKGFADDYVRLVAQTGALFGARHYRGYHWLLSLSDHVEHFGLEHHESSDDRMDETALSTEWGHHLLAGLLAHEFVHSWNGKYRRPAGLLSPDYLKPMDGSLLWVYEGMTEYLGYLLPARAGIWTPEYYRERLATVAATLDHEAGRTWRPLGDTAVEAQVLYGAPHEWWSLRRGTDFYEESVLLWLEVDMMIRKQTGGHKSLDDFCHEFHGGQSGYAPVNPYTLDDVVAVLNHVAPYDWKTHLTTRINSLDPHAPMGGIELSGWKLAYDDQPNLALDDMNKRRKVIDLTFSLGLQLLEDGTIRDITPGMAAATSGLAPGMKVLAINGRKYTNERLEAAVREAHSNTAPIHFLVENSEDFVTFDVDAHQGLQYPHLVRDAAKPDLLTQLVKPLTAK